MLKYKLLWYYIYTKQQGSQYFGSDDYCFITKLLVQYYLKWNRAA